MERYRSRKFSKEILQKEIRKKKKEISGHGKGNVFSGWTHSNDYGFRPLPVNKNE